ADAAGNEGTATLTVSIIVPDTTPPVVTFSPASITVTSGGTAAVTLAATDDVDGELVPVVTCTQGSFANDTYTAPDVSVDTGATCTATAADAAGNEGTATLTVSIIVPDTTPPVVTFTPATLTVASGGTASSTLTATDNVAVTEGPTVTCTQGSFDPDTNTYTALDVSVDTEVTCAATATDAAGNTGTATLTVTVTAPVAGPDITMSPVVSFSPDRIIVKSGAAIVSTLTATDDGGVTEGPIVTCTQGGSFEGNTYTAPDVTADTTDTCTATASDAGGNEGTATLTAVIIAPGDGPDRTPPVMTFSPATLIVGSRETARSTLTAADNVGIVFGGPGVTCNLGSFDRRTNTYTAPTFGGVPDTTVITCTAAAEDAAGNTGYATLRVLIKGRPIPADLTPPVVSFNPTALTVVSRTTGTLALTVTDNVGVADVKTGCLRGSFDPDTGTYTAFPYDGPVSDWCDVTAVDAAGNKTLARIRISIIVVDETPPVVFFNPESLTVDTGGTAPSTLISVDNVDGITEDLRVTCTRGSFRGRNTYIAPVVSEDTRAECRATAADAAGNQSLTAILRVFITAMDTTAPVPGFNPATLDDVASGATVFVTLTATDNVDRAITPTVTCMQGSFANNAYTAPVVSVDTADTCTATATDAAGNAGTATLTVSIVAPDITPPVLTFSPDTLTVISGTTASVTLTANDNEGITRGPMVSCFRGQGSFNIRDSTYTAPAVSTAIRVPCTARAFDAAGNRGVARFWVSVVPDRMRPELIFSPAALAVDSGATVAVTLTATDNVGITRGPVVTCTVGSFSIGDSTYTAPVVSVDTTATCTATAADAAGTEGTATLAVSVTAPGEGPDMTPPVLTFSPAALTVVSGGTASVAFAATDNVGIVRGPVVNCDHGSFSVMDNTYTAPAVREAIRAVCRARAFDAAGNRGRAKLTVFVISPDRKRPVLSFNPRTLSVGSGATASVTFTATDNVGIAGAPVVVCYPGSFNLEGSTFTYTAPVVSVDTGAGCKARARDAAGNRGAANLKVSITAPVEPVTPPEPPVTAPDETAPVVSFSPVSLTLVSGGTGLSRVTATDSDDNVLTPTVSCTNGGEYDVGTGVFTAPTVTNDTFSICTAMATDGDGNTGSAMLAVNITSPPVSCPDGFTESSGSPLSSGAGGGQTLCTGPLGNLSGFAGVLTESARIPYVEGVVYELSGRLDVGQAGPGTCTDDNDVDVTPVVLTIEAGVTIVGDSGADFMVVNRCHRIDASGTSEAPIVFTSRNDVAGTGARDGATGEWGGVVILGNAPINRCNVPGATGGTAACENTVAGVSSPDGVYGGGSSASDSGTLEYVTVRHAGAGLNAGLTLGGVGSGTTVNYIQVHNSSGDGIRVL
ncbi:MAG: hypothetical protein GDA39_08295, partial [Hyphomonadaceae bacterium]|nr:hypothetical protein [Hyphomonadaceae bacterium]